MALSHAIMLNWIGILVIRLFVQDFYLHTRTLQQRCTGNWTFRSQDFSPSVSIQRFLLIQLKPKYYRLDVFNYS